MKDYTYIEDITSLKDNILDEKCKIIYMKRKTEDYFIHIVCCEFSDVNSLKANWKELTNNVSDVIQKGLSDLIEIYNIYIVFFQPNIKGNLIYNIEQNKFSSRKIVLQSEMPKNKKNLVYCIVDI